MIFFRRVSSSMGQYFYCALLAMVNEINAVFLYFIEQGYSINLPFININYAMQGVFENPADSYDSLRPKIAILVHLG